MRQKQIMEMVRMGNKISIMEAFKGRIDGTIQETRKNAITTKLKTHIIDTCYAVDTGEWETAIEPIGKSFVVVEQYGNDPEKAKKGHNKWVKTIKENPNYELKEILTFGF